jgi:nucleoside permease NupC
MMAKLIEPETDNPVVPKVGDASTTPRYVNLIDAAATGALDGLRMAAAIAAMLIAFVALIALVNGILQYFGAYVGYRRSHIRDDSWLSTESCSHGFWVCPGLTHRQLEASLVRS